MVINILLIKQNVVWGIENGEVEEVVDSEIRKR